MHALQRRAELTCADVWHQEAAELSGRCGQILVFAGYMVKYKMDSATL